MSRLTTAWLAGGLLGILVLWAIAAPHAAGRLLIAAMLVIAVIGCAAVGTSVAGRFHRLATDGFAPQIAAQSPTDQPELLARLRSVSESARRSRHAEVGGAATQIIRGEVSARLFERHSLSMITAADIPQIAKILSPKLFVLCIPDIPAGYPKPKPPSYRDLPDLLDEVERLSHE